MNRTISLLGLGVALVASLTLLVSATPNQDDGKKPPPPQLVGIKGCKKCHQKSSIGKQYKVWAGMKHAKAFELLKTEEAAAVATKLGLEKKPFEAPECLKCHTTGYGLSKKHFGEKFDIEQGVTCEACHGPGEFFAKPADGKLHKEAHGKGYLVPDEKLCRQCHNEKSPTWDPERDTTKDGKKVGFDFAARVKMVAHPIPKKKDK